MRRRLSILTLIRCPLGIQASQLLAVRWAQTMAGSGRVRVELLYLDLYSQFDVDRLTELAEPTVIQRQGGRP